MPNSYTRADLVAAWQFEDPAPGFLKDTKAIQPDFSNTGPVTQDTTNYMEGARCASFAAGQHLAITDANLVAGFPFKSGDAVKLMTLNLWLRPTTVDANKRVIASKWNTTGNQRGWSLSQNSTAIYLDYSNNGTTVQTAINFGNPMTANQKYLISLSIDAVNLYYWFRIFSVTAGTWATKCGALATTIFAPTADFRLGADCQVGANLTLIGQIDEALVFASRLHNSEVMAIKNSGFPVAGVNIYDWLHDPGLAADTYDGFSAAATAYKTMKHNFGYGDIIYIAKATETAQSGTATATNGSNLITGISGWTPAAGDILRFESENVIYAVKTYDAGTTTITMYKQYRGVTGSGKTINKFTPQVLGASQDWDFLTCIGSLTERITLKGGVNLSTFAQEGFSIINRATSYISFGKSLQYWDLSKIFFMPSPSGAFYNAGHVGCTFKYVGAYGQTFSTGSITSCVFGDPDDDDACFSQQNSTGPGPGVMAYNCVFHKPHIGIDCQWGFGGTVDTLVNDLICDGQLGGNVPLSIGGLNWGLRYVRPNLDALDRGSPAAVQANNNAAHTMCEDVILINPRLGPVQKMSPFSVFTPTYLFNGEINLVNIDGDPQDHRTYYGCGLGGFVRQTTDYDVYHTAAPSVRFNLPGVASFSPFYVRHYIPCNADETKVISAYLRKNSNPISVVTLANGGSGYVVGDVMTIVQAGGAQSVIRVTALSGSAIATFTLVRGGFGYALDNGLPTANLIGTGAGATFNITGIGTGYGSATLPFMRVRWFTGTAPDLVHNIADYPMANVNDAWERVESAEITPSIKGTIIVELFANSVNTGAMFWYDDILAEAA